MEHWIFTELDHYWTYLGSLTTPPLFESVTWTLFSDVIEISQAQVRDFTQSTKLIKILLIIALLSTVTQLYHYIVDSILMCFAFRWTHLDHSNSTMGNVWWTTIDPHVLCVAVPSKPPSKRRQLSPPSSPRIHRVVQLLLTCL